jgi:tetratricopeptide (TPR) repeat protein
VWQEVRSPHFTAYAQSGSIDLTRLVADVERFRQVLDRTTGLELETSRPVLLFVFATTGSYMDYAPRGGKATVGYYGRGRDTDYLLIHGGYLETALPIVYHEYVHLVLNTTFRSVPLWLNEGLAEFYSTYRFAGGNAATGRPVPRHLQWLANHPAIPLATLFAVTHESPEYNENEKAGAFYAQSWALVHMLFRGPPGLRSKSGAFLAAVLSGEPVESAVRTELGMELPDLERMLREYWKETEFTFTVTSFDDLPPVETRSASRVERVALLGVLGDLLFDGHQGKSPEAEEHYGAALSIDPANGRALAGLAALRAEEGKHAEAKALYEQAVERAPGDPTVLARAGLHRLEAVLEAAEGGVPDEELVPEIQRARALLERSLAISSPNAVAQQAAGITYLLAEGDLSDGARHLEAVSAIEPGRGDVLRDLVVLYARMGDRVRAKAAFDRLLRVGTAEEIADAREAAPDLDLVSVDAAVEERDYARALELLRGIRTDDPALSKETRERIALVEARVARDRDRAGYDAALPLYEAGKWAEARKALEALLRTCTTEDICKAARRELADLPK